MGVKADPGPYGGGGASEKGAIMTVTLERAEEIIAAWRSGEEPDSPAGPLLPGTYAESEITMTGPDYSGRCGTGCTGSRTYQCC
jgi:hypothetical protein